MWQTVSFNQRTLYLLAILAVGVRSDGGVPVGFFTDIQPVAGLEGTWRDAGPYVTADHLTMLFHSDRPSDDPDVDNNLRDIWTASRASPSEPFGPPVKVNAPISVEGRSDHYPYLAPDGLSIYFSSNRPPEGQAEGRTTIHVATRTTLVDPWSEPVPLTGGFVSLPDVRASGPALSPDQLTLYFHSTRNGTFDLFQSSRSAATESFGSAEPLSNLNTPVAQLTPTVSSDQLTLFYSQSDDNVSLSSPDLMVSSRENLSDPFGPPVNINDFSLGSSFRQGLGVATFDPYLSPDWPADGSKLYFALADTFEDFDIWEATWAVPEPSTMLLLAPILLLALCRHAGTRLR